MSVALLNANVAAKSLHDEIIGALPVRYFFKDGTTPLSNTWVIGTESVAVRKNPTVTIEFDQWLTAFPSSINLLNPECERDLITIKLVVYHSLDDEPVGWNKSPVGASSTFRFQLLFLKWRIQNGIESYSKLNAVWYRQFVRALKSGGRDALLSMPERTKTLCAAWDTIIDWFRFMSGYAAAWFGRSETPVVRRQRLVGVAPAQLHPSLLVFSSA